MKDDDFRGDDFVTYNDDAEEHDDDFSESVKSGAKVSESKAFDVKSASYEVWEWASDDGHRSTRGVVRKVDDFVRAVLTDDEDYNEYDSYVRYVVKHSAEDIVDELVENRANKLAEERAEELAEERAVELADELVKKTIKEKLERGELILPPSQAANGASDALLSEPGVEKLPKRSKAARERTREIVQERKMEHCNKLVASFEQMVPKEYLNYPYDEYIVGDKSDLPRGIQRDIRKFVKDAKESRESLKTDAYQMAVVSGRKNGTGKTTTAIAIAREIVSQSLCSGAYVYASDALSRASYMYDEVVQELVSPRVLVIDDVGVSKADMSDRQRDAFHYIIDQRWADPNKITIITTNLPFTSTEIETGLSGYVGRALWSRISDRLLMIEQNNNTHRGSGRGDDEDDE